MEVRGRAWGWTALTIGGSALLLARTVVVGADYAWAPALGEHILATRTVPTSLPFAAAPTDGWPDVGAVGQVLLALVSRAGPVGPGMAQLAAALGAWILVAAAARVRGGSDPATAAVLVAVILGAATSWGVVRLQLLSLVPFALLLFLLHREHARPSRRIWWVPVLVGVWGNLHGGVLVGVAVTGAYLLAGRLRARPTETLAVGTATLAALLANPAGGATFRYYAGVLANEAARSRTHLWAPPDLHNAGDVVLMLAAAVLLVLAVRARPAPWEWVALAGLLAATMSAARNGLWLLMLLAPVAAAGASRRQPSEVGAPPRGVPIPVLLGRAGIGLTVLALAALHSRGAALEPVEPALVAAVRDAAGPRTVLAPEPLAESLASAGVRVWACDPIDAFDPADQRAYLAFLDGSDGDGRAVAGSDLVVLREGDARLARFGTQGWVAAPAPAGWVLLSRPG